MFICSVFHCLLIFFLVITCVFFCVLGVLCTSPRLEGVASCRRCPLGPESTKLIGKPVSVVNQVPQE